MNKRKNGKRKFVISFIIVIYIVFFLRWVYDRGVSTDIIKYGNIQNSIKAEGVILRDEICYSLDINGQYIPSFKEGAKVAKNTEIAVGMSEGVMSLFKQRQQKSKEIYKIQNENNIKNGVRKKGMVTYDNKIKHELQKLSGLKTMNMTYGTSNIKQNINDIINKKYDVFPVSNIISPQVKVLKNEIDTLDSAIEDHKKSIMSKYSGTVSYKIDNLEKYLQIDDFSKISIKQLNALKDQYENSENENHIIKKDVPFVKIITDYRYNIVVQISEQTMKALKETSRVLLRILKIGKTMDAKIIYTGTDSEGKHFAVFSLNNNISGLSDKRFIKVDIVINAYGGLKVPISCLTNTKGNKATLIKVENNCASFVNVSIIGKNNDYAIIKGEDINLYDVYVIDPRNIKEGQVIE